MPKARRNLGPTSKEEELITCKICKKELHSVKFSKVQQEHAKKLRYRINRELRNLGQEIDEITKEKAAQKVIVKFGPRCFSCLPSSRTHLVCVCCNIKKTLDKFAKNQRQHDDRARCMGCMKEREEEDNYFLTDSDEISSDDSLVFVPGKSNLNNTYHNSPTLDGDRSTVISGKGLGSIGDIIINNFTPSKIDTIESSAKFNSIQKSVFDDSDEEVKDVNNLSPNTSSATSFAKRSIFDGNDERVGNNNRNILQSKATPNSIKSVNYNRSILDDSDEEVIMKSSNNYPSELYSGNVSVKSNDHKRLINNGKNERCLMENSNNHPPESTFGNESIKSDNHKKSILDDSDEEENYANNSPISMNSSRYAPSSNHTIYSNEGYLQEQRYSNQIFDDISYQQRSIHESVYYEKNSVYSITNRNPRVQERSERTINYNNNQRKFASQSNIYTRPVHSQRSRLDRYANHDSRSFNNRHNQRDLRASSYNSYHNNPNQSHNKQIRNPRKDRTQD